MQPIYQPQSNTGDQTSGQVTPTQMVHSSPEDVEDFEDSSSSSSTPKSDASTFSEEIVENGL